MKRSYVGKFLICFGDKMIRFIKNGHFDSIIELFAINQEIPFNLSLSFLQYSINNIRSFPCFCQNLSIVSSILSINIQKSKRFTFERLAKTPSILLKWFIWQKTPRPHHLQSTVFNSTRQEACSRARNRTGRGGNPSLLGRDKRITVIARKSE